MNLLQAMGPSPSPLQPCTPPIPTVSASAICAAGSLSGSRPTSLCSTRWTAIAIWKGGHDAEGLTGDNGIGDYDAIAEQGFPGCGRCA